MNSIPSHVKLSFVLLLFISVISTHAYISIWSPRSWDVVFHDDLVPISWVCTPDDTACQNGIFSLTLWQKDSLYPSKLVSTLGVGNGLGVFEWRVPETITPGDYFYVYAENNASKLSVSSSYFTIRHMGFHVESPSLASVWVPGSPALVSWTLSGYFDAPDASVVIEAHAADSSSNSKVISLGKTQAGAGKFVVDPNDIPWDSPLAQGSFVIHVKLDSSTYGTSTLFMMAKNRTAACDLHSAAAGFSHAAYGVLKPKRSYDVCGRTWDVDYVYNIGDNAALIVSSPALRVAIVSFRGTIGSVTDWMNTLSFSQKPCTDYLPSGCAGGYLHAGFARSYNFTAYDIRLVTSNLMSSGYSVILTGHSKGAAIATIQAYDLIQTYPQYSQLVRLMTFGSPRPGDKNFAAAVENQLSSPSSCKHLRYVNSNSRCGYDPVTTVPPSPPYYHSGPETVLDCPYCLFRPNNDINEDSTMIPQGVAVACHGIEVYKSNVIVQGQGHLSC